MEPAADNPSKLRLFGRFLGIYWRSFVVILWPILMLPVFVIYNNPASRCGYVVLVMGCFWITEALPLPITSMIPVFAFPIMGILNTDKVCMLYFKETNMMYVGGLMLAIAVEFSGLHTRIALKVMLIIGTSHFRLTLGLMLVTMFVSMWVSNTAATAMMAPIVIAILQELEAQKLLQVYFPVKEGEEEELPYPSRTTRSYFFCIAYASTIGGTGTIVGTGTNLTFKGIFESRFEEAPQVDFGKWMAFNFPGMILNTFLIWLNINWQYLGFLRNSGMDEEVKEAKEQSKEKRKETETVVRGVVSQKLEELGPMTYHEGNICVLFVFLVLLWVFRSPGFITGWAEALTETRVKDATAAIGVGLLFFSLPATLDFLNSFSSDPEKRPTKAGSALLNWKFVSQKMPWGLLFLLGGGFALAEGSQASGLSKAVGESLDILKPLPALGVAVICCFIATNLTEFSANVAIANILLPVLAEMAITIEVNPLYLMIPTTLCCSFAFMMPVGTPPNAIVAGMANIRTKDMIVTGIIPTIITLITSVAFFSTWGSVIYEGGGLPAWAKAQKNTTK